MTTTLPAEQETLFGFTIEDLSVLDLPKELHPECYAEPDSLYTFRVQSATNRDEEYTTRHDGAHACGCNCIAGLYERVCWQQKRIQYHLDRRAARLAAQTQQPTQPSLFQPQEKRDISQLGTLNGDHAFRLLR